MSTKTMDYFLTFRADASQGKAEVADMQSAIVGLHTQAENLERQSLQGGAGLGGLTEVAGRANSQLIQNASASAAAGAGLSNLATTGPRATSALGQVQGGVNGLTTSMTENVDALLKEGRASAAWRSELDLVRAQFNPIFAASQQYEQQLRRIADAEDLGAISAREAGEARNRAAHMIAPVNQSLKENEKLARGAGAANAYYMAQANDVVMMTLMGQDPAMLMLQQGPQINQMTSQLGGGKAAFSAMAGGIAAMLSPISLVTMGVIGLGAAGVQALQGMKTETVSFKDGLGDLDETFGRMRTNLEMLENVRLGETFGSLTGDVRGLAQGLLEVDRASELQQMQGIVGNFLTDEIDETAGQLVKRSLLSAGAMFGGSMAAGPMTDGLKTANVAENYKELGAANSLSDFQGRTAEIEKLAQSGDVDEVVRKLLELQQAMSGGENVTKMSKELRKLLGQLARTGIETARIEAMWNGSAQAERVQKQITEMVSGYAQQAELSQTALQHGENSTEVEVLRQRHARETLKTRLKDLGVVENSAEAQQALAALEATQAAKARQRADARAKSLRSSFTALGQELALSETILRHGQDSAQVEALRVEHAKAALRLKLQEQGATELQIRQAETLLETERERRRLVERAGDEKQAGTLLANLERQHQLSRAILTYGQGSLQVKTLQIAAARAEFEQQLKSLKVSEQAKQVLRETWEATRGLNSADPFGRLAATQGMLSRQNETLANLKLELSLIGQGETVRRRVLALYEAEVEIRRRGLDVGGSYADQIRDQAAAAADLRSELDRQAGAWDRISSAADGALDGSIDALLKGDYSGALEGLSSELTSMLSELAIKNPIKNALFGTDLGTLQDVGGLGGMFGRLLGGGPELAANPAALASQAASMAVTTPMVTINAGAISGLSGLVNDAGLTSVAGMSGAGLGGSEGVQRQVWDFFSSKGLKPHQVAAIVGNVSAESGFNPLAVGDGGDALGLFQHNDRAPKLLNAIGGRQNLGDVQGQLEFAWQELLTSENGVLKQLMSSQNVYEANKAFIGFERPSGWTPSSPTGGHGWDRRLGAAEAAMTKFSSTTTSATQNLGTLGQGFDVFGTSLGDLLQGGIGGGQGGGFSGLLSGFAGLIGIPGFSVGGGTGGDDPSKIAGFVHQKEYVFDAESTARIGVANLEAIRRGGGKTAAAGTSIVALPATAFGAGHASAQAAAPRDQAPTIVFKDYSSGVRIEPKGESRDADGNRQFDYEISDTVGAAQMKRGGKARRNLHQEYGLRPKRALR